MADEPPKLKIVATNDHLEDRNRGAEQREREFMSARRFAALGLQPPLLKLASNILRIVRGAGKPGFLAKDCADLIEAFAKYHVAFGELPGPQEIHDRLRFDSELRGDLHHHEFLYALQMMTRGGLQFAASSILGQRPQMCARRAGDEGGLSTQRCHVL